MVAIARGGVVGVDVETRRNRRHLDRLAARSMTPAEHERWQREPEPERLDAFLRLWTAKEAYLKATGHGLVRPMRSVTAAPPGWTVAGAGPSPVNHPSTWDR